MSIRRIFQFLLVATGIITLVLIFLVLKVLNNQQTLIEAADYRFTSYQLGQEASASSHELTRLARTYVITGEEKYKRDYWLLVDQLTGKAPRPDGLIIDYTELLKQKRFSKLELAHLAESNDLSLELVTTEENAFNIINEDRSEAIRMLFDDTYHVEADKIQAPVKAFQSALDKRTEAELNEIIASSNISAYVALTVSVIVLAMVLISYLVINKKVIGPVSDMVRETEAVASGDLSRRATVKGNDEIAQFSIAFNAMLNNLHELIDDIRSGAAFLKNSSVQIAGITNNNLTLMQDQKNETDMVATAATEMSSTIQEVADNCLKAAKSSDEADELAVKGRNIVSETVDTISSLSIKIEEASVSIMELQSAVESVSTVVDVINGIAEQTNLLALNAAIEAARAGEQGRGFAVVADEVRTLAQRTQDSTNEIMNVIEVLQQKAGISVQNMNDSMEQNKTVVARSNSAGSALIDIADAVVVISNMTQQIAQASEEQSFVAEDIGKRVVIIDDTTSNSVVESQKLSEMTKELEALANRLSDQVARFKL